MKISSISPASAAILGLLVPGKFLTSTCAHEFDHHEALLNEQGRAGCTADTDCNESQYCGGGVCQDVGQCLERIDCLNPANNPIAAFSCVGYMDCASGKCQMQCGSSFCPEGEELAENCDSEQACNVEDCPGSVSCGTDFCGGCYALFFDAAGNQLCKQEMEPIANASTAQLSPCASDADCLEAVTERSENGDHYCAQGFCREKGTCGTDMDCYNPANEFNTLFCVGYFSCLGGTCSRVCGPSCPDGGVEGICEPNPCDANPSCPGSVSCINDGCDGCNAIYFDAAGSVVTLCDGDTVPDFYSPGGAPEMPEDDSDNDPEITSVDGKPTSDGAVPQNYSTRGGVLALATFMLFMALEL
eukprot:CAMPEP_0178832868 /NCGR_PEP_ID=MMETSP0746-20121128/10225_1 /TAXON_ID=913974 /ORGANISM="Nitzschia punctata, Strain CCMP561" /LENGTH=357 /DNA_ID=CAMNT_0020495209 /DNA_START=17 /DNA_END=1090 /DNA_ORIENTATION=+